MGAYFESQAHVGGSQLGLRDDFRIGTVHALRGAVRGHSKVSLSSIASLLCPAVRSLSALDNVDGSLSSEAE